MTLRLLLAAVVLALTGGLLVWQVDRLLADPTVWPPDDFVEYWAAGRLHATGQDPYAPELLLPLERSAGRDTDEAVMMWNPPWTLPVVLPLGLVPARTAQLGWLLIHLAALGFSAVLLWKTYGGAAEQTWLAVAVTFGFVPTLMVLNAGQIGPLLVLGAALFAWAAVTNRPLLAGAATVLLAIKPHLAYLLWAAIFVDAISHRRWRILAGGATVGLAFAAAPLILDPAIYHEYAAALRDHPPAQWVSLTLGTLLRVLFGAGKFWLQFVPLAIGFSWFGWYWRMHRRNWNWAERLPMLLLVSFVTSPYGAWHFDLVLLVVPVIAWLAAGTRRRRVAQQWIAFAIYVMANVIMLIMNLAGVWSFYFAWVAPAVLVGYLIVEPRPTADPV